MHVGITDRSGKRIGTIADALSGKETASEFQGKAYGPKANQGIAVWAETMEDELSRRRVAAYRLLFWKFLGKRFGAQGWWDKQKEGGEIASHEGGLSVAAEKNDRDWRMRQGAEKTTGQAGDRPKGEVGFRRRKG